MDDAAWSRLTKLFPRVLRGAHFSDEPLRPGRELPPFLCGAFSPDGRLLALSGGGRIPSRPLIWVARVPSLDTAASLRGHQGVHALAWDPTSGLLASSSNDYTTVLWDIGRRDHLFACGGDDEPIVKGPVAFGADALYVGETEAFEGLRARLLRVSLRTGEVQTVCEVRDANPDCRLCVDLLAVEAPSDRWAIVATDFDYGGSPRLLTGAGTSVHTDEGPSDADVHAIRWRAGALMVAESNDGVVQIRLGAERRTLACDGADRVAFSDDGERVAVARGPRVHVLGTRDGTRMWTTALPDIAGERALSVLAWSRSGADLAVAGSGGGRAPGRCVRRRAKADRGACVVRIVSGRTGA